MIRKRFNPPVFSVVFAVFLMLMCVLSACASPFASPTADTANGTTPEEISAPSQEATPTETPTSSHEPQTTAISIESLAPDEVVCVGRVELVRGSVYALEVSAQGGGTLFTAIGPSDSFTTHSGGEGEWRQSAAGENGTLETKILDIHIGEYYVYVGNIGAEPLTSISGQLAEQVMDEHRTYEVTARLREDMPEYRFVAKGLSWGIYEWTAGYILGLEGYDENGASILSADFSAISDGEITGNYAYNNMMDTMGLHVVDVNFDGYKDVIIINDFGGAHSNSWYDCWLWDAEASSFAKSESFTAICNPALDPEKQCIYSSGGSGAEYWGGSVYRYIGGEFILTDNLDGSWRRIVESRFVDGEMKVVREVALDEDTEKVREQQAYYATDEFWQWQLGDLHSRWYMHGGHHADEWLGG